MHINIYEAHGIKGLHPYLYNGSFTTDFLPNIGEMFDAEDITYKIIDKKYKLSSPNTFGEQTMECDLIVKKMK